MTRTNKQQDGAEAPKKKKTVQKKKPSVDSTKMKVLQPKEGNDDQKKEKPKKAGSLKAAK